MLPENASSAATMRTNDVSLKGDLPDDRESMIKQLEVAQKHSEMWKDERFRML